MDIAGAIKAGFEFAKLWASRAWGTQTRDQSTVERDIANAREKKSLAFEDLRNARGDEQILVAILVASCGYLVDFSITKWGTPIDLSQTIIRLQNQTLS